MTEKTKSGGGLIRGVMIVFGLIALFMARKFYVVASHSKSAQLMDQPYWHVIFFAVAGGILIVWALFVKK